MLEVGDSWESVGGEGYAYMLCAGDCRGLRAKGCTLIAHRIIFNYPKLLKRGESVWVYREWDYYIQVYSLKLHVCTCTCI